MVALIKVLEAYGCLRPLEMRNDDTNSELNRYNVTLVGEHVGSLGETTPCTGRRVVAKESSEQWKCKESSAFWPSKPPITPSYHIPHLRPSPSQAAVSVIVEIQGWLGEA
jgi:hypothetical protein